MRSILAFGDNTFDSSWIRDEYNETANVRAIKKANENQK